MYTLSTHPIINKQKGIGLFPLSCCNHYLLVLWLGVTVLPHLLSVQSRTHHFYANAQHKLTLSLTWISHKTRCELVRCATQ